MSVHRILRQCASDLLETEQSVTVEQVVQCAYRNHGEEFEAERERLVLNAAKTQVAKIMRELTEDEDTPVLPGLGLPSAIAVQAPNGTYYVRSDKATWGELVAGRDVRSGNVTAARRKLSLYDEAMAELGPLMERNPGLTVAGAVRLLAKRNAA